jgi:CRP-like cAMP-binding protein
MSPLTVFDELTLHALVGDLPMGWLHRLAMHGRSVVRPPGYRLLHQGGPAENFWLLRSGIVEIDFSVPGEDNVVIDRVGVDGVIGCSWLVAPYRCTAGAVVTDEIWAVEFGAADVRNLIGEDPAFGLELTTRLVAVLTGRLQAISRRLVELHADADGDGRLRGAAGPAPAGPPALF